jgi:hypothetical protein
MYTVLLQVRLYAMTGVARYTLYSVNGQGGVTAPWVASEEAAYRPAGLAPRGRLRLSLRASVGILLGATRCDVHILYGTYRNYAGLVQH